MLMMHEEFRLTEECRNTINSLIQYNNAIISDLNEQILELERELAEQKKAFRVAEFAWGIECSTLKFKNEQLQNDLDMLLPQFYDN